MGNTGSSSESNEDIEKFKQNFMNEVSTNICEIHKLLHRFEKLGGTTDKPIPLSTLVNIDELRFNPFRYRIARVFGEVFSYEDPIPTNQPIVEPVSPTAELSPLAKLTREQLLLSSQDIAKFCICFDSFLKLLSSFSSRADLTTKTRLAFALYDFDQDGQISLLDIECMISVALGKSNLHPTQYRQIAHEIMNEVDIDGNGTLTELEFSRVLGRVHDFQDRLTFETHFS